MRELGATSRSSEVGRRLHRTSDAGPRRTRAAGVGRVRGGRPALPRPVHRRGPPVVELAGVVTRSPDRRAELAADFPGVPAYDSLTELLAAGIDAVAIHHPTADPSARGCWRRSPPGCPRSPTSRSPRPRTAAGELVAAAPRGRRPAEHLPQPPLGRRRTSRTLAAVLRGRPAGRGVGRGFPDGSGRRGHPGGRPGRRVAPRPGQPPGRPGAVAARPGPPRSTPSWTTSSSTTSSPGGGTTDCRFTVSITHRSGVRSRVSASKINHIEDRELRAYGSAGSYVARGSEQCRRRPSSPAGARSTRASGGATTPRSTGAPFRTADGSTTVPSEQGAYQDYYTRFAAAVAGEGEFPVPADQAVTPSRCSTPPGSAPPRTGWSTWS